MNIHDEKPKDIAEKVMMTFGLLMMWPMMYDSVTSSDDMDKVHKKVKKTLWTFLKWIWLPNYKWPEEE